MKREDGDLYGDGDAWILPTVRYRTFSRYIHKNIIRKKRYLDEYLHLETRLDDPNTLHFSQLRALKLVKHETLLCFGIPQIY